MSTLTRELYNKKILITGADGFLGSYFIPQIKQVSKHISLYQDDVRNIDRFRRSYDLVFHLAAFNKVNAEISPGLLFDVNVNGTLAVMRYCHRRGARCIFASSSAVYKPVVRSRKLNEGSPLGPVSLYGMSKMLAESICRYYAENFGLSVTALRIFNMYGPGQQKDFLIPYVIGQLSMARTVTLNLPKVVRDFIYVADVAKAFVSASAVKHKGFLALNVGTGVGLRVCDLVKKLALKMGVKPKIKIDDSLCSKKDCVVANLYNTSRLLHWIPEVSLDKGLVSFIANRG